MPLKAKIREQAKSRSKYEFVFDCSIPCWDSVEHYRQRHQEIPGDRPPERWSGFGQECEVLEKRNVGLYTDLVLVSVDGKEFWTYSTDIVLLDKR